MIKLTAPDGACSFSHGGIAYEVKAGTVDVPDEAVPDALSHGFAVPVARGKAKAAEEAPKE
jgi:hypothetical protein